MRRVPPSPFGPRPCLTAFSASVSTVMARHAGFHQRRGNVDLDAQPLAHADLLDVDIGTRERQFMSEREVLPAAHLRQRRSHVLGEALQHRPAPLRVDLMQPQDVRERVEEEVRLDLRLQRLQPHFGFLALGVDAAQLRVAQVANRGLASSPQIDRRSGQGAYQHQLPGCRWRRSDASSKGPC